METISRDQLASITGGVTLQRQLFHLDRLLSHEVQQQATSNNTLTTVVMATMLGRALRR